MAKIPPLKLNSYISDLAASKLLEALTATEVVLYVRLLGMACKANSHRITPTNEDLVVDRRTSARALKNLAKLSLVRVTYNSPTERTIEVMR